MRRADSILGEWVSITMASVTGVVQAAAGRVWPSISTMHMRHAPDGASRGSAHNVGIAATFRAASSTV